MAASIEATATSSGSEPEAPKQVHTAWERPPPATAVLSKRCSSILEGLPGVVCLLDDILIYGQDEKQHNTRLEAVLDLIQAAKVTQNREKCKFGKTSIRFLGHIYDKDGVLADPKKTAAIQDMRTPISIPKFRHFLGMVSQLGKFSPAMAELTKPLRELLSKKSTWLWGPSQEEVFQKIKSELASPLVLAWYNPDAKTKVSSDALTYDLRPVLLQRQNGEWKPIAYASRSLTEIETGYAQIEKEALATTWACERFSNYTLGKRIYIETDHKPLVPLLKPNFLTACHHMYYSFTSFLQDPSTQLNRILANSSTLLMPCHEHPWDLPRLITVKLRLLRCTCQSSCPNSLPTRTAWKLTAKPKPMTQCAPS